MKVQKLLGALALSTPPSTPLFAAAREPPIDLLQDAKKSCQHAFYLSKCISMKTNCSKKLENLTHMIMFSSCSKTPPRYVFFPHRVTPCIQLVTRQEEAGTFSHRIKIKAITLLACLRASQICYKIDFPHMDFGLASHPQREKI